MLGRIMPASNHTFLTRLGEEGVQCVYKPSSGERPLWDFTDGTLAAREYAAWVISDHLGWDVVPPTVLRDGPAGPGMVQLWMESDEVDDEPDPVDIVPEGAVPPGYLHVLDATGADDEPVSLVHEDSEPLRRMAVFDIVTNNTDRKGGHVLPMPDGHRYGVDHGVCFHVEDKLRTVLWGWAGQRLSVAERDGVECVLDGLAGDLRDAPRGPAHRARGRRDRAALPSGCWARAASRFRPGAGPPSPGRPSESPADRLRRMRAWTSPEPGTLPGGVRGPAVRVFDSSTRALRDVTPVEGAARMYVCGITPYDATHMGHAATYVAFDLLNRAWRSAGHDVRYVQNVTDVDDPLLERAVATGEDWVELAERETELFRGDMEALRVLAPDAYIGAVEAIPLVVEMVERLQDAGSVYEVPTTTGSDSRPVLLRDPGPGLRRGLRLDPRADARGLRGARAATPTAPARRTRWTACSGSPSAPANQRGTPSSATAGPVGTSSAPRSRATTSALPPRRHRRAGRRQRPGLPAPRDERLRGAGRGPRLTLRAGLRARRHGRPRRREDVEVQGQPGAGLAGSATAGLDPMVIRLVLLGHHYRSDWQWDEADVVGRRRPPRQVALRGRPGVRRRRPPRWSPTYSRRSPRTSTPPPPCALLDHWADSTDFGDDHRARAPARSSRSLVDAALGVRAVSSTGQSHRSQTSSPYSSGASRRLR